MITALLIAIGILGSRRKLAKAIGATPDALNGWLNRGIRVPLEYAIEIDRVTNGVVKWQELAPHLAHYSKHWVGLSLTDTPPSIQMKEIALPEINHACKSSAIDPLFNELLQDIQSKGLKQPICIDTDNSLIFGRKRLLAYKRLNKKTIPAYRMSLLDLITRKYDNRELSQLFVFSERIAIGMSIEQFLGKRRVQHCHPLVRQCIVELKGHTDEFIADLLNFGNRQTYNQAKRIFRTGSSKVIQSVDEKLITIPAGAILAQLSLSEQNQIIIQSQTEIVRILKSIRKQNKSTLNQDS